MFYSRKVVNKHGWQEFVIHGLLPFSVAENVQYRKHVKYQSISVKSLRKYVDLLTSKVEAKISALLPNKFGIVFDGWSQGDTHYASVLATYSTETPIGNSTLLSCFSPFEDELTRDAANHVSFLKFVLSVYKKDFSNLVVLMCDTCATNKALSDRISVPMIGFASHIFNLGMKDMINESSATVEKLSLLMKKLKQPILLLNSDFLHN